MTIKEWDEFLPADAKAQAGRAREISRSIYTLLISGFMCSFHQDIGSPLFFSSF